MMIGRAVAHHQRITEPFRKSTSLPFEVKGCPARIFERMTLCMCEFIATGFSLKIGDYSSLEVRHLKSFATLWESWR